MRLAVYTPGDFKALERAVAPLGFETSLRHRQFVEHYYCRHPTCRLWTVRGDDGAILGTLGVERMRFQWSGREVIVGSGSNFHGFQRGVGGFLYREWLRACDFALVFGGSHDAHRIYRQQRWHYFPDIHTYRLNPLYSARASDGLWRRGAKWLLRRSVRTPLARLARRLSDIDVGDVHVREESAYTADLIPTRSPFTFRYVPTLDELAWRYSLDLSFVRYRLFRVLAGDRTVGYVVLNVDQSRILVAHSDGEDPHELAIGTIMSVLEVGRPVRRPLLVVLASSDPVMRAVFERFGFRTPAQGRPFAMHARTSSTSLPTDPAGWLVNYDWGDNGLRPRVPVRPPPSGS